MVEDVRKKVVELLSKDDSGHGMDHINRVVDLSLKFAKKECLNCNHICDMIDEKCPNCGCKFYGRNGKQKWILYAVRSLAL